LKARSNGRVRTRYLFRKTMEQLKIEHEEVSQKSPTDDL